MAASRFVQPLPGYYGEYRTNSWAGYVFKEALGYTSGLHTGADYNGPGAGNADLGMPVVSISNGIVRSIVNRSDIGFGLTTIIEYPLTAALIQELGCDSLFGRYMHQQNVTVSVGQNVAIGQQIGTVGNSGTVYAHLHVDIYKSTIDGGGVHFRYDKDTQLASYLDPYEFIQNHLTGEDTALLPYQRIVGASGVNYRKESNTGAEIIKEFTEGEILDFKGFVKGEAVNGNNIWFVGKYTSGYAWSGAFTDNTVHDLPDLTPTTDPTPSPTPQPQPAPTPPPAMFGADSPLVDRVIPSPNFADVTQIPKFIVIHQWGAPSDNYTLQGVINHFLNPRVEVAAHYVVGSEVVQMVKENKRAWHAGPSGNDGIGIECDPNDYSKATALIEDIRKRYPSIQLRKHSEFMATECPKYIDFNKLTPSAPTDIEARVKAIEDKLIRVKEVL